MDYFKVIEMLAKSFPRLRITIDAVIQVSKAEIEIAGNGNYRYNLEKVGWDLCFMIKYDGVTIDNIINYPTESEVEFVSRVISLINNYK